MIYSCHEFPKAGRYQHWALDISAMVIDDNHFAVPRTLLFSDHFPYRYAPCPPTCLHDDHMTCQVVTVC